MVPGLGGCPSKLTPELIEKGEQYVTKCEEAKDEIMVRRGLDDEGKTRWEQTAPRLPNLNRLALVCGIHKQTLYRWRDGLDSDGNAVEKDAEYMGLLAKFRDLCTCIENLQELCLVEEGAAGRLNPAVATRIMASKHGYAERTENTTDLNVSALTDDLKDLAEELRHERPEPKTGPETATAGADAAPEGVLPDPAQAA
jgi:hypothetical protein